MYNSVTQMYILTIALSFKMVTKYDDIEFLLKLLRFCNFLGVIPADDFGRNIYVTVFAQILWFAIHIPPTTYFVHRLTQNFDELNIDILLGNITSVILIIFVLCSYIRCFLYRKKVVQFIEQMYKIDTTLHVKNVGSKYMFLKFVLCHLIILAKWFIISFPTVFVSNTITIIGFQFYFRYLQYIQFLSFLVIFQIQQMFSQRFYYFNKRLRGICLVSYIKIKNARYSIVDLKKLYLSFINSIQYVSEILSFSLTIIILNGFMTALRIFNKVVEDGHLGTEISFLKMIILIILPLVSKLILRSN